MGFFERFLQIVEAVILQKNEYQYEKNRKIIGFMLF